MRQRPAKAGRYVPSLWNFPIFAFAAENTKVLCVPYDLPAKVEGPLEACPTI